MIKLFKFFPAANLPDLSPFCMKTESFFRMAGLAYEPVGSSHPSKGPKGKLPYIEDGEQRIGDSSLIIDYLIDRYDLDIDRNLTPQQTAVGHCVSKILEERFYWIIVYSRWIDVQCWPTLRDTIFAPAPPPLRSIIAGYYRHRVKRALYEQGTGRHSREEIYRMGRQDLQAVSDVLGSNDFILGERPSRYDCSVHAFVAAAIQCSMESPLTTFGRKLANLEAYTERMNALYYGA